MTGRTKFIPLAALTCTLFLRALAHTSVAAGPPINDAFSNRIEMQLSTPVTASFAGASRQTDEPDFLGDWRSGFRSQHPIWWNWTSTVSTSVCLVARMPQTRPLLMVFEGSPPGELRQIGALTFQSPFAVDGTNVYTTEVHFAAVEGTNYVIAADSQVPLTLAWDSNTETNLAGYRLFVRGDEGSPDAIDVGNVTLTSLWGVRNSISNRFALTAYDRAGRESPPSPELVVDTSSATIPAGEIQLALTIPPIVAITDPLTETVYAPGADISLTSSASDADGTIDRVEYYVRPELGTSDETLLAVATNSPYAFLWTNLISGRYVVSARAYDDLGSSSGSEPILVIVGPPANDRFVDRAPILNNIATGTTRGAGKESGEPALLGGSIATRSVWWTWLADSGDRKSAVISTLRQPALAGVFSGNSITNLSQVSTGFVTTAIYESGLFSYKTEVSFTPIAGVEYAIAVDSHEDDFTIVLSAPPTIAITVPNDNSAVLTRTNLLLQASAADVDGTVDRVDYYYAAIDGRKALIGSSTNSPDFDFVWKELPTGRYAITAAAVDNIGAQTLSAPISLTVGRAPNDNFANRITLSGGTVFTNVAQFVAGKELGEPDAISSISVSRTVWYSWTAPSNGTWAVVATTPGTIPLVGAFTGTTLSNLVQISDFRAADAVYSNAVAYTTSEAHFTATSGTRYAIVVDAADQPFSLAITPPPRIQIVSPASGVDVAPLSGVEVSVVATDPDGFITRVEYSYDSDTDNAVLLAINTNAPFTLPWMEIALGAYQLTARAVDNFGASTVSAPIRITSGRPPNDNFANRIALFGSPAFTHASNIAANTEPNEPESVGTKAGHTLWWSWTASFTGRHVAISKAPNVTPVIGVFAGTALTNLVLIGHATFGGISFTQGVYFFSAESTFDAVQGTSYSIMVDSSYGPGTDLDLMVTAAPRVQLTRPANGANFSAGSVVTFEANASDIDGAVNSVSFFSGLGGAMTLSGTVGQFPYVLSLTNLPPGVYTAEAHAADDVEAVGISDDIIFTVDAAGNDSFTNRVRLVGSHVVAFGSNYVSTREPGEPQHATHDGQNSVWWTWSPPIPGTYAVSTEGSGLATLLGIYLGPSVSNLTSVASAAFNGSNNTSLLMFDAAAGKSYQIAVDGFVGAVGNIILSIDRIAAPKNDNFDARTILSGFPLHRSGHNTNATSEVTESDHAGNPPARSVWWSWTAPANGTASIDTQGSSFDTVLGIYVGSTIGGLAVVAEDDDSGNSTTSLATFSAHANTTYQIVVDGFAGAFGKVRLNLEFLPDPLTIAGLSIDGSGLVALRFEDAEGQQVIIEASDDLNEWFVINSDIVSGAKVTFFDPTWGQLPRRFYRAILDLSPPPFALSSWSVSTNAIAFDLLETEGAQFVIEASEDLELWKPVSTNTVREGRIHFTGNTGGLFRFYRGSRRLW